MDERTSGIILRVRPYTETSLIVQWLTRDCGRISTLARGARRPKSPFRGKLDLFFQAELSFQRSRNSTLHSLREVVVREMNKKLRTNPNLLQQTAYAAHLIEHATETDTPVPAVHELFIRFMECLGDGNTGAVLVMAFEVKFLAELGLPPPPGDQSLSEAARKILEQMAQGEWATLSRLHLSTGQFNELRRFLGSFIAFHLCKLPLGRAEALP